MVLLPRLFLALRFKKTRRAKKCLNDKKIMPCISEPNIFFIYNNKGRLSVSLLLGLGILDSALCLTQCSIIKELAHGVGEKKQNTTLLE